MYFGNGLPLLIKALGYIYCTKCVCVYPYTLIGILSDTVRDLSCIMACHNKIKKATVGQIQAVWVVSSCGKTGVC